MNIPSARHALMTYLLGMGLALVPLLVFAREPQWLNIIAFAYLMGGLATAWNIIGGFGGQFSLGHGVFFAIGAYVTAQLYMLLEVSPWISLLIGAAVAAAVSALISWPTFRLRGPFFAIATLAFNEVAFVLVNHFDSFTGGPRGILIPFRAGFERMIFTQRWHYGLLMFGFVALTIGISLLLRRSRLGYYLLAVREDEAAAGAAGINVLAVKLQGMALSAALTSVGGSLFAMYLRYVDPSTVFSLQEAGVKFALLSLIGGVGTIFGPLMGAALIVPVENILRAEFAERFPGMSLAVVGLMMVLGAIFMKHGIAGVGRKLWLKYRSRGETSV